MGANDRQEFIIMLLIENRSYCSKDERIFYDYLKEHYDLNKFNERYMKILDDFMKTYALNNTEKYEQNL